jgi:hypothetical protein
MPKEDLYNTLDWQNRHKVDADRSFIKSPVRAADAITAADGTAGGQLEVSLESGHIRSDIRKEFMRAGLNTVAGNALLAGENKVFLDAYKLAASDPEIGLTGPSTVLGVSVNIGDDGIGGILKEFMGASESPQNIPVEVIDIPKVPEDTDTHAE